MQILRCARNDTGAQSRIANPNIQIEDGRVMTDESGNVGCWADYYPFGENTAHNCVVNGWHLFAGLFRDGEDGDDSAANRRYASNWFRWNSPDPAGVKVVSLTDPQTWNLYMYSHDNPVTFNDPSGLQTCMGAKSNNKPCLKPKKAQKQTVKPKPQSAVKTVAAAVGVAAIAGSTTGPGDSVVIPVAAVVATAGVLYYKNKDAIKHGLGELGTAAHHIKLLMDPNQDPNNRGGWKREARAALQSARKWTNRMSPGVRQRAMNALIDMLEKAVPNGD